MDLRCVWPLAAMMLTGCFTSTDPLYCDENTPCQDATRTWCDLNGEQPASGGIQRTCIEPPADSVCNAAQVCADETLICTADGKCVECEVSSQCPPSDPVCDVSTNTCGSCTMDPAGDAVCADASSATPVCGPGGACVECNVADDCGDAAKPLCDDHVCRGCMLHAECPSQVCDKDSGQCVDESMVAYASPAGNGNCEEVSPCKLADAVALAGKPWVKLTVGGPGNNYPPLSVSAAHPDGVPLRIVGLDDRSAKITTDAGNALAVADPAVVVLDSVTVSRPGAGIPISCTGANLTVRASVISQSNFAGIDSTGCTIRVSNSFLINNDGGGLDISSGGEITLLYNTIADNGGAGGIQVKCAGSPTLLGGSNLLYHGTDASVDGCVLPGFNRELDGGDDPFVNRLLDDYHLDTTDTTIVNAVRMDQAAALGVFYDIDGDGRPQGAGHDFGADEVVVP